MKVLLNVFSSMCIGSRPYCPQLNPVENVWEEIREKHFTNLVFSSMNAVEDQLSKALLDLENHPETAKSISSFSWIVTSI